MANKITKVDNFKAIRDILVANNATQLIAFVDHELELLANKAERRSNTLTPSQKVGLQLKEDIYNILVDNGEPMRIVDIRAAKDEWSDYTSQKIAAQLLKLIDEGKAVKEVIKRVNYYKAV